MSPLRILLVAGLALVGACSSAGSSTTTTGPVATTSPIVMTTAPATTTSTSSTTTTTTLGVLPDQPLVSAGWSLEGGDLLVAGRDGVHVVRDGLVVSQPITSPVEAAFADSYGAIVFVTPDPDRFPDHWPTRYGGGGYVVWRAFPDGTLDDLLRTGPLVIDGPVGKVTLYQVGLIDSEAISPSFPAGPVPVLVFNLYQIELEGDFHQEEVAMLAIHQDGIYPSLTGALGRTEGESGFTGAGWQGTRVIVSTTGDGGAWLEAWPVFGLDPNDYPVERPAKWPTNPCPNDGSFDQCLDTVTTLPGTGVIAFTQTDILRGVTDLVVYDTDSGTELVRLQVAERPVFVKQLHAGDDKVVVSLMTHDGDRFVHLPAVVLDVATGSLSTVPVAGVTTVVG